MIHKSDIKKLKEKTPMTERLDLSDDLENTIGSRRRVGKITVEDPVLAIKALADARKFEAMGINVSAIYEELGLT